MSAEEKDTIRVVSQNDLRSLVALSETASTCRVLNLGRIFREHGNEKEYQLKPFFRHSRMNKCILVKHALRSNELAMLPSGRRTATKIIFPFDVNDLSLGGQSVFVSEYGFDNFLRYFYDTKDISGVRDVLVLRALDALPSLDPFLVRECLGRQGIKPGTCYLKISPADIVKMLSFCNAEIEDLVTRAVGGNIKGGAASLAGKILASGMTNELTPLRDTMHMAEGDFSEGLFAWRGFLYFKWRWIALLEEVREILDGLAAYVPRGCTSQKHRIFLNAIRPRIGYKILKGVKQCSQLLQNYDGAYKALIEASNPIPFRNFLINGPKMFYELGEILGVIDHIASLWKYRITIAHGTEPLTYFEYADILNDFEENLEFICNDQKDGTHC